MNKWPHLRIDLDCFMKRRIFINDSEYMVIVVAFYMLYRTRSKSNQAMDDLRMKFQEVYKRHKVDIIGFWQNADDSNETFYLSRYDDENDYKKKVDALRNDADYRRLSHDLQEIRQDIESIRLLPK